MAPIQPPGCPHFEHHCLRRSSSNPNFNWQTFKVNRSTPTEGLTGAWRLTQWLWHVTSACVSVPSRTRSHQRSSWPFSLLTPCDLTLMALQRVGSHAETASNSLEILSPNTPITETRRERERGWERGRARAREEKVFVDLYTRRETLTVFTSSASNVPLELPTVCAWARVHLWNVSCVSSRTLHKLLGRQVTPPRQPELFRIAQSPLE